MTCSARRRRRIDANRRGSGGVGIGRWLPLCTPANVPRLLAKCVPCSGEMSGSDWFTVGASQSEDHVRFSRRCCVIESRRSTSKRGEKKRNRRNHPCVKCAGSVNTAPDPSDSSLGSGPQVLVIVVDSLHPCPDLPNRPLVHAAFQLALVRSKKLDFRLSGSVHMRRLRPS